MIVIFVRLLGAALFLILCAGMGAITFARNGVAWGAFLGAWLLMAYHIVSAQKMMNWLEDLRTDNIPKLSGWWDELAARIYRNLRLHNRQQHALAHALVSFRSAAQALPDGVVTLDADNRIAWCNETAEEHLGLRLSTDMGQPLINLVRSPEFSSYLNDPEGWDKPLGMRSLGKGNKVLSIQVISYGDQQLLVMSRDVTQLERLERMRRDFVANVSHELKTPLTVLSGFLETVRELPLQAEQRDQYLELMHDQAIRMQRLVEDLLTLSSLESAPLHVSEHAIDLHTLFERMESDAKALSGGKHVLTFECDPQLGLAGAETELQSALSNLVSNAIRYTPEGGAVSVRWRADEQGRGRFEVQDSGIGIEAHHLPRLTERFYRVDRSRSRESGGTGLGLAIVKHVLTRHGGYLDVTSVYGKGSTFAAVFPAERLRRLPPKLKVVSAA